MSKVEMPVSGGGPDKGAPDGVSGSPGGGFMGHGGQTETGYHGGGQAGDAARGHGV